RLPIATTNDEHSRMVRNGPSFDAPFNDKLVELFRWRRDVRRFRTDPVPPDLIDRLLQVASLAPSVGLSQP
ncbi:nitroreductase family protein, partial [Proteus vulgaris]|uniref:nitroreductase family protein n=1 Tax=Proteus vulgaris TaxID=585 RepID=UPI0019547749